MKTALTAAVAIIAIVAVLLSGILHSAVFADSPPPSPTRASQSPDDASQALRRYALQLLHILSAPHANKWERYRQAISHCDAAPEYLAEIGARNDVSPLDSTLAALTQDLCRDLDRRLNESRTVGLLVNEPEAMRGYTLIPGRYNNYVHLIDHLGRIAHSWQFEKLVSHARLLDNGNLLIRLNRGNNRYDIAEVDSDSNIVWQYSPSKRFHHDFLKMPSGNVLMLMRGTKTREEAIAAGADSTVVPSRGMRHDYIIEVRPTGDEGGEIVWEWSPWDYLVQDFDPSKPNYGDPSEHPELIDLNFLVEAPDTNPQTNVWNWLHINGIDYNPDLNQIMLSPRHHSELWIIDRSASTQETPTLKDGNAGRGGALLYRWGNPRAYRHGTTADQRLFWQHHTQWIAPGLPGAGNILVFNNGYGVDVEPPYYSSIEEIVPPIDGYGYRRQPGAAYPPVESIWTYAAEPPSNFFSLIMGCVQRLPNGNTLICDSTSGNVFQVTPDGTTVWQYVYPMDGDTLLKQGEEPSSVYTQALGDPLTSNAVYRAYWYAPDHPGIQKLDPTPGDTIELYE